jgi:hypothetical protein
MTTILLVLFFVVLIISLYFLVIRRWQTTWGATKDEVRRTFLGDDVVTKPHLVATRAVTIHAPPSDVWKWIIQIGSARAGFYSLDWVDNAGVASSRDILPQFQKIETGYFIPFTPNQKNGMWVKDYTEYEHILWWDKKGNGTWGWYLMPIENGMTRLITRLRTRYDFSFPWILYYIFYDLGDIVMMRKCLLGIKARAENILQKAQMI